MNIDRVDSGADVPNEVNVIIEIPAHSDPVKYEVDKTSGAMFVDRFMTSAMHYPCNYGYIPKTLAKDVCRRAWASKGEMRTRRWTPDSLLR